MGRWRHVLTSAMSLMRAETSSGERVEAVELSADVRQRTDSLIVESGWVWLSLQSPNNVKEPQWLSCSLLLKEHQVHLKSQADVFIVSHHFQHQHHPVMFSLYEKLHRKRQKERRDCFLSGERHNLHFSASSRSVDELLCWPDAHWAALDAYVTARPGRTDEPPTWIIIITNGQKQNRQGLWGSTTH